jgi:hypothetical protein
MISRIQQAATTAGCQFPTPQLPHPQWRCDVIEFNNLSKSKRRKREREKKRRILFEM